MGDWNEYYFPQEVLEQADAVRNSMAELEGEIEKLAEKYRDVQKVYIVGSGDCYFISLAAAEAFRKLAGTEAYGYEAYDFFLEKPKTDGNTMVILFSSSGKSLYVLKSLEYVLENGGHCYWRDQSSGQSSGKRQQRSAAHNFHRSIQNISDKDDNKRPCADVSAGCCACG